ncbi:GGDEF domain-containing protein [Nakamurella alba]|uniref:GGDEF domain-containing protein n=1 Tax=Nakamurella alba TaxID=2665158 RepID=UPI0018AA849B|nr:GGDEF domain-containing protein [Nakamurella alba]
MLDTDLVGAGIAVTAGLLIAAAALWIRRAKRIPSSVWTAIPFVAITAILVVDLATHDASVQAQLFFLFPVLFAAVQLRRVGAIVVTTAALAALIVVVGSQLPFTEAGPAIGYMAAVMTTTSVLLVLAGERQDRLIQRLQQLAAADPLTGLATRNVLDQAARSALSGANSDSGTCLALLDIDNFKTINDTHGHPAGDAVLVQLATRLMAGTRPTDVIGRLGGDEIALLLPACTLNDGSSRLHHLLDQLRQHRFRIDDIDVPVTVSAGIAHAPTQANDLRELYTAADTALYQAKRSGKDQMAVWR